MALTIELQVKPSSSKQEWCIDKNGKLKIALKSPAIEGKANKELIKVISHALRIPQADIEIISGLTSKSKRIKIHTALTMEQFLHACGLDSQRTLI